MNASHFRVHLIVLCIMGFLLGCRSETAQRPFENTSESLIDRVEGLSRHYVRVRFIREVGEIADTPSHYRITDPNGKSLGVKKVLVSLDRRTARLTTEAQEPVPYVFTIAEQDEAWGREPRGFSFAGATDLPEPYLASVVALDSTRVMLAFSEPLAEQAVDAGWFRIPGLQVEGVQLSNDGQLLYIETSPQEDRLYTAKVSSVTSSDGAFMDPAGTLAQFRGVAPEDNSGPVVRTALATDPNTIHVSFNEPLRADSIHPSHFRLDPALDVLTAQPTVHKTQVVLKTATRIPGMTYLLRMEGLEDIVGNSIDVDSGSNTTVSVSPPHRMQTASELPRVVGAASTSNTSVLVVFSKAMADNAEAAQAYVITQENVNPEAGALIVTAARFFVASRSVVELTTLSQNELTYKVTVVGVTDDGGNPLAPRLISSGVLIDPTSATFPGTPPSGLEFVDSDGDGLMDNEEQRGWVVTIHRINGSEFDQEVTSSPFDPDTDRDGIGDALEFSFVTNPRASDTDGDGLSDFEEINQILSNPNDQDSDQDSLGDALEVRTYKTSPLFADTDGDQIDDRSEILAANRDPRISDLPRPRIRIGNVAMSLDTRFSFTDTFGESMEITASHESTLTQSETAKFTTSDQDTTTATVGLKATFEAEITATGGGIKAGAELSSGLEEGHTSSFSSESVEATEEAYHESLTTTSTVDASKSVNREVVGAKLLVDVAVENAGDIPFSISDLELTVLQQNPRDRRQFLPVASLQPASNPELVLNLGPAGFGGERGPFVFSACTGPGCGPVETGQVFPSQIEDLLKNPRGLVVKLANFEVQDEGGRSFAFSSQRVLDRTAGLTFDFGDGSLERYRIATSSRFDENGLPEGVTMSFALQDILGLAKDNVIRDGGNGYVDTTAVGDDVQLFPLNSAVPVDSEDPFTVIITVGPNGILDTAPTCRGLPLDECTSGDDDFIGGTGYETREIEKQINAETVQVQILSRVRGTVAGSPDDPSSAFWVVLASKELDPANGLDDIRLVAGDQLSFAFVKDEDGDGLFAREEELHGSSDKFPNTDGCQLNLEGSCEASTFDTLTDAEEAKEGWNVFIRGETARNRRVYSDPVQPDSDRDGLLDHEERGCGLDPRQRDTDLDGLSDFEEIFGGYEIRGREDGSVIVPVPYAGTAILDGGNGRAETSIVCISTTQCDIQIASEGQRVTPGAVIVLPGPNGLQTAPGGDDFIAADHIVEEGCALTAGFATDPLDPDTDSDGILDGAERVLGINPNDSRDGPEFFDDDLDGVPNRFEVDGFQAIINGQTVTVRSDPDDPDSDNDGLPDLLEHKLGSDPRQRDTDGDGIADFDEYKGNGEACVTEMVATGCIPGNFRRSRKYQEFLDECSQAAECNFTDTGQQSTLEQFGSRQEGTNLNEKDTDFDTLDDPVELGSFDIVVNGEQLILDPSSNPFLMNSDTDEWSDRIERHRFTNPFEEDTDGDSTRDDLEDGLGKNPTIADKRVNINYTRLEIVGDCDLVGVGEFTFSLGFRSPNELGTSCRTIGNPLSWVQSEYEPLNSDGQLEVDGTLFIDFERDGITFVAEFGEQFNLCGHVQEIDPGGAGETLSWDTEFTVGSSLVTSPVTYELEAPCGVVDNSWIVRVGIIVN